MKTYLFRSYADRYVATQSAPRFSARKNVPKIIILIQKKKKSSRLKKINKEKVTPGWTGHPGPGPVSF